MGTNKARVQHIKWLERRISQARADAAYCRERPSAFGENRALADDEIVADFTRALAQARTAQGTGNEDVRSCG